MRCDVVETTNLSQVTFAHFVTALASSAMVHLGETADPAGGGKSVDLGLARDTIDTIAMLEDKTAGNLSEEEASLLTSLLDELRGKYVAASKAKHGG